MKPIDTDKLREGSINWEEILKGREEINRYFHTSINEVPGRYWIRSETTQLLQEENVNASSRAG